MVGGSDTSLQRFGLSLYLNEWLLQINQWFEHFYFNEHIFHILKQVLDSASIKESKSCISGFHRVFLVPVCPLHWGCYLIRLLEFCEICLHKCSVNGYLCLADINCDLLLSQSIPRIFMRAPCDQTFVNLETKSLNNEIGSFFFFPCIGSPGFHLSVDLLQKLLL